MNKIRPLITLILLVPYFTASAQDTITLAASKDAFVNDRPDYIDRNFGTNTLNIARAWAANGVRLVARGLVGFDLSGLPSGAVITNATLFLGGISHNPLARSNAFYLERVTSPWQELQVTWNSQPTATPLQRKSLERTFSPTQDYAIDITDFVQGWVSGTFENHGMRIVLKIPRIYTSLEFATRENPNVAKRPQLVIAYRINSLAQTSTEAMVTANPAQESTAWASPKVFPNPNHGAFTLTMPKGYDNATTQVYAMTGQLVYESRLATATTQKVRLDNIEKGVYVVKIVSDRGMFQERVIVR